MNIVNFGTENRLCPAVVLERDVLLILLMDLFGAMWLLYTNNRKVTYDVISCINVLDRCDRPLDLLSDIYSSVVPGVGWFGTASGTLYFHCSICVFPHGHTPEYGTAQVFENFELAEGDWCLQNSVEMCNWDEV